ncbi:adhesin, partial [Weissella paramesenteroides]
AATSTAATSTAAKSAATSAAATSTAATSTAAKSAATSTAAKSAATSTAAKSAATSTAATSAAAKSAATSAAAESVLKKTKISMNYKDLINVLVAQKAISQNDKYLVNVNSSNFLDYFSLNGSADYNPATGIVTITPNENNQVGNFSLKSKIDMNKSFTLTGSVNLGSDPNGADGIGFAFHNGNTTDLGNSGGNLGIGGLSNAVGFKLDTWYNDYSQPSSNKDGQQIDPTDSNGFGWNKDSMRAPYGAFVETTDNHIRLTDGTTVQRWWATDVNGSAKSLSNKDINGDFHKFVAQYDGDTRVLTIYYTETDGTVLSWSEKVSSDHQAMAMIVSASTGGAKNLQQFKIDSFQFNQAASVNVLYVDQSGKQIARGDVQYPDGNNVNGEYNTTKLDIPNYTFLKMDDGKVTGNVSKAPSGTLTNAGDNGTVIYVYTHSIDVTTESKTVNETIHYVYENGETAHDDYIAQPVT